MNRKNILFKNISLGVFYKFINMAIVFLTIPILLNYLEKELYGIWVTIFSIVNIVFFMDGGIGNGLKTKLAYSISKKNIPLSKTYITTSYVIIIIFSLLLFSILSTVIYFIDLKTLLNTNIPDHILKRVFYIILGTVTLSFILNLYKSFFYAKQEAAKIELSMLLYQFLILICISLLLFFFPRKLVYVALSYGISNLLLGIVFTYLFFKKNRDILPSMEYFDFGKIKELLGLSLGFFIIQLSMIIIFTTDNLIISHLLGPEEVTNYDISYKIFGVIITLLVIVNEPLWALFTDSFNKKDFKWIRKTLKKINIAFIFFVFLMFCFYLFCEEIIKIWLQRDLEINDLLLFLMFIFVIIRVFPISYMFFLNGIGNIKFQVILFVFGALINIPLSFFFTVNLKLGTSGVILGTICSILLLSILLPIQTYKILNKSEVDKSS